MTYTDVLSMPTYERRFFIGRLTKDYVKREEIKENGGDNYTSNTKGTRKKKISGDALKTNFNNGNIPLT